ncbi:MAG: NAD(P)-dependent oxidoreductase [Burkholderiaceae bacterium]|jgi:putative dehydrogenase
MSTSPEPSSSAAAALAVAWLGAGNMGMGMVQRWRGLARAAWVCDIDPARQQQARALGATVEGAPASLVSAARAGAANGSVLLMVVVVTAEQVRDVLWGEHGAATALQPQDTVVLCPTIAPEDTEHMAQTLQSAGIGVIDAPMSGGPQRAAQGTMSLMVAADPNTWQRHQPTLACLANPLFYVGARIGDGARTKLVNNLLAGVQLAAAAEALAWAEDAGLDPLRTLEVIEQSSGQSWIGSHRIRRALAGDTEVQAHMSLLTKDTRLAVAAAEQAKRQVPLGQMARDRFAQACNDGLQGQDDSAMLAWCRQHLRQKP